jgi:hypothetical protein
MLTYAGYIKSCVYVFCNIYPTMKSLLFVIGFSTWSMFAHGQDTVTLSKAHLPKHYISFNPLNIIFFQQAGLTYEYKPGILGYGITAGYIYPNNEEYSNWFIAGPVGYGSLGYYSGFFFVPQLNIYLTTPKTPNKAGLVYMSLKGVYKHMYIDSTASYAWDTGSDDYYWVYRKMVDQVNIYGAFLDFGFKFVRGPFFFDLNIGPGVMFVNHNMVIAGETYGLGYHSNVSNLHPPKNVTSNELNFTINFVLNIGIAL